MATERIKNLVLNTGKWYPQEFSFKFQDNGEISETEGGFNILLIPLTLILIFIPVIGWITLLNIWSKNHVTFYYNDKNFNKVREMFKYFKYNHYGSVTVSLRKEKKIY